jgi:hypothetical protein
MTTRRGKKAARWALIGALLLSPASLQADSVLGIVLRESGQVLWEKQVSTGSVFSLRHLNSIFDAPVEEAFRVDDQGLIRLQALRTDSAGVLEYYGLEEVSPEWITLCRPLDRLYLIISTRADNTFRFEKEEVPLSELLPDGARIEIRAVSVKP